MNNPERFDLTDVNSRLGREGIAGDVGGHIQACHMAGAMTGLICFLKMQTV